MLQFLKTTKAKKLIGTAVTVLVLVLLIALGVFSFRGEPENPIGSDDIKSITLEETVSQQSVSEAVTQLGDTYIPPEDRVPPEEQESEPEETDENTDPSDEPQESAPNQDDPALGEDGGENSSGEGEGDPSGEGEGNDDSLGIRTDLKNGTVFTNEIEDDVLPFYASIANGTEDMVLTARLSNSATSLNGERLIPDGENYKAMLTLGYNYITFHITQDGELLLTKEYKIWYESEKASEENPNIGENPPTIETSLDGRDENEEIRTQEFTFTVKARTYNNKVLHPSNITVTLDGKAIKQYTGVNVYEYVLWFEKPPVGDTEWHTVTVTAWDNEGNSSFKKYNVLFKYVDIGDVNGTVTVIIDATTVGLGILDDPYECEILQGYPASYTIVKALEEMDYEVEYRGTLDVGFFLSRISRGSMCTYADIPDNLEEKIKADGYAFNGQKFEHSLGDGDYYDDSGWMYSIGGTTYAGKSFSEYQLKDGDVLYLRYTLAGGKDISSQAPTGDGLLSSYCGTWLNGSFTPSHALDDGAVIKEATCKEEGEFAYTCRVDGCGYKESTVIPKTDDHSDYTESDLIRVEPTATEEGYVGYNCKTCGQLIVLEVLPIPDPEPEPEPNPEPEPEGEPTE